MRQPVLIVLNGPSSAGKSSIAYALQKKRTVPLLHFKMDMFWDMVPEGTPATSKAFPNMRAVVLETAKTLVAKDHDIFMDIVFMPQTMLLLQENLKAYHPFCIAVTAPVETLRERERQRGDRDIGLAESQVAGIHKDTAYDLVIDTSLMSPEEAADAILAAWYKKIAPQVGAAPSV